MLAEEEEEEEKGWRGERGRCFQVEQRKKLPCFQSKEKQLLVHCITASEKNALRAR